MLPIYKEESFISQETNIPELLNSIVVPRPIAFVTSKNSSGVINAAPFSYFNVISKQPPLLSLSIQRRNGEFKDTAQNILFLKEFVVNICSFELANAISIAGVDFPPEISEVDVAKLSLIPSQVISVPRIANTCVQLECLLHQHIVLGINQGDLFLGKVVRVHLHKDILDSKGRVDIEKLNPIARLAGSMYAKLSHFFDTSTDL